MVVKDERPVRIDLSAFKLHVCLKPGRAFTLHFNTPSRRFYLSLIGFLVSRMKRSGRITSVALEEHLDLLALLNETVGESAGSSGRDNLLGRIYRKWKSALPDLEKAPLFRVLGKTRATETGLGTPPSFTDAERDLWANLFEYTGSEENVRLRFSLDRIGLGLDDVLISWEGHCDLAAWEQFVSGLRQTHPGRPQSDPRHDGQPTEMAPEPLRQPRPARERSHGRRVAVAGAFLLLAAGAAVTTWQMRSLAPSAIVSTEARHHPLPDKPSLAVLPFTNMSGDPGQDFVVDGITETIITALSAEPRLFVIARNSTFTYKDKAVNVQEVAETLGVQYVLEGGVQKSGERVRITAQLIDSAKGNHLWSETYDRSLEDIFAVQDDITQKILTALQVELTAGEQARVWSRGTNSLKAYLKRLQALEKWYQMNIESNALARQLAEESIALDPDYAGAYTTLAATHILDVMLGSSKSPKDSMKQAIALNKKALLLDASMPQAHSQLGFLYMMTRQYDEGIAEAELGVELDPNAAGGHDLLGMTLMYAGRPEDAIPRFEKAIRLHPLAPGKYYYHMGEAYLLTGQCDQAISACEKALRRASDNLFSHLTAAVAYSMCGKEKEAQEAVKGVLRIDPNFSCDDHSRRLPYKNQSDVERYIGALRKAGLD